MPLTAASPRLYFEDRGAGDPMLAIVGFAVSSAVLEPLAGRYASRMRLITYDHPATGRSSKRSLPCSAAQLAASALRVLDELGIEAAHVAGLSLGGVVAQELALRHPHRVRGLILMGTSPGGPLSGVPDPRSLAGAASRVVGGSLRRRRPWLGPAFFSDAFLEHEPDRAAELLALLGEHPAPPWGILGQFCAAGRHVRTLDVQRIRAPTLVLHGDRDAAVPLANARLLAQRIPDAELHVFHGAGHGFVYEHLEETLSIVCDWLARRQPSAGETASGVP
jgi:pimeloyl-ACP methyl ester carboxylesterase